MYPKKIKLVDEVRKRERNREKIQKFREITSVKKVKRQQGKLSFKLEKNEKNFYSQTVLTFFFIFSLCFFVFIICTKKLAGKKNAGKIQMSLNVSKMAKIEMGKEHE